MIQARQLVLGVAIAAAFGASAQAADMPGTWGPEPLPPRFVELSSPWYARADAAYRFNNIGSLDVANTITSKSYQDTVGLGLGIGYKYQWFRTDVTLDYGLTSKIRAISATTGITQPQYTANIDTVSLLGNAYLDLGTWYGFTPYVGGGLGMSYLRAKDYVDTTLPGVGKITNARTSFSWAAMAGVSYQIDQNWIVDVGYRYLALGDVPTTRESLQPGDLTNWKQLSAQEVRFGLRMLLH